MSNAALKLVHSDDTEYDDGDGEGGDVVCPDCGCPNFRLRDDDEGSIYCPDCGCEIDAMWLETSDCGVGTVDLNDLSEAERLSLANLLGVDL